MGEAGKEERRRELQHLDNQIVDVITRIQRAQFEAIRLHGSTSPCAMMLSSANDLALKARILHTNARVKP